MPPVTIHFSAFLEAANTSIELIPSTGALLLSTGIVEEHTVAALSSKSKTKTTALIAISPALTPLPGSAPPRSRLCNCGFDV